MLIILFTSSHLHQSLLYSVFEITVDNEKFFVAAQNIWTTAGRQLSRNSGNSSAKRRQPNFDFFDRCACDEALFNDGLSLATFDSNNNTFARHG
jgi:hypothetical protein